MAVVEINTAATKIEPDDQVCMNCHFYEKRTSECRRHAPTVVMIQRGMNPGGYPNMVPVTRWPTTSPSAWCGEFEWLKR